MWIVFGTVTQIFSNKTSMISRASIVYYGAVCADVYYCEILSQLVVNGLENPSNEISQP